MSQDPFAGQAARLITGASTPHGSGSTRAETRDWMEAAEACVMSRIGKLRIYGGLPLHAAPLSETERCDRLKDLLKLWADGCLCVVDEQLFADLLKRRRQGVRSDA